MTPALNAAPPGAESGDENSLEEDAWKPDCMPKMELHSSRLDSSPDSAPHSEPASSDHHPRRKRYKVHEIDV